MSIYTEPCSPSWVCVDCYVLLVNGDSPTHMAADELHAWDLAYQRGTADCEVTPGMLAKFHECAVDGEIADECECEQMTFSWSPCAICRSHLGGSRHAVTFWTAPRELRVLAPLAEAYVLVAPEFGIEGETVEGTVQYLRDKLLGGVHA